MSRVCKAPAGRIGDADVGDDQDRTLLQQGRNRQCRLGRWSGGRIGPGASAPAKAKAWTQPTQAAQAVRAAVDQPAAVHRTRDIKGQIPYPAHAAPFADATWTSAGVDQVECRGRQRPVAEAHQPRALRNGPIGQSLQFGGGDVSDAGQRCQIAGCSGDRKTQPGCVQQPTDVRMAIGLGQTQTVSLQAFIFQRRTANGKAVFHRQVPFTVWSAPGSPSPCAGDASWRLAVLRRPDAGASHP